MNAMKESEHFSVPRSQWCVCLSALNAAELKALAARSTVGADVIDLQPPKAGLGLLQFRDSALGDAYFLGEIPVAKAHVRITSSDGRVAEGAALLMDDRTGLIRALAILDAVLANRMSGWEAVEEAVLAGQQTMLAQAQQRHLIVQATRVDFSLLSAAQEDDDV